ncbi:hypothetical protein TNCV_2742621 [Trichonephila clavipes]|nr:hypothetical protein TNCV_2742621 [Trichonephila clavipes]
MLQESQQITLYLPNTGCIYSPVLITVRIHRAQLVDNSLFDEGILRMDYPAYSPDVVYEARIFSLTNIQLNVRQSLRCNFNRLTHEGFFCTLEPRIQAVYSLVSSRSPRLCPGLCTAGKNVYLVRPSEGISQI